MVIQWLYCSQKRKGMDRLYSKFRFIINNILLMFAEWCAVYVMVTGETGCSVTVFQEDLRDISSDIIVHRVAYVLILSLVYSLLCDLSISFGQSRQTEQTLELIFERLKSSSMSDNERQNHRITGYTDINTNSYSHMPNVQVLLFNFECFCIMFYSLLLLVCSHVVVSISSHHVLIYSIISTICSIFSIMITCYLCVNIMCVIIQLII